MTSQVRSHGFTALGPLHETVARLAGWPALLAAFAFGALSAVAFAPFHFSAVLAISFTGIVWMIDGARAQSKWGRAVFLRGWAFGVGFFLVSLHWTAMPFLVDPARTIWFIWMPIVLLPAGMAVIWGAFTLMAGAFWSASPSRIFIFSLFFALAEFTRGTLFGGFPWNLPGTTWLPGAALSQLASLGGVYWLTLVTVFIMASPAALVDTREARGIPLRVMPALASVVALALGWAWGAERTAAPSPLTDQAIVVMDAGVPQDQWDTIGPDPVLYEYIRMLSYPDSRPGDVVVWPESAVPAYLLQDANALDIIAAYIGQRKLIIGTARYELTTNDLRAYYNSLSVVDETVNQTGPLALYDKHRLVPFGELAAVNFIPYGPQLSRLLPDPIQRLAADGFRPGAGATAIDAGGLPPFVALICYEGLFPEITRGVNLTDRAQWMVLISNDAWFGAGMGPAQHYAQNRYRAIETGLPLVRAANRGTSGIIDGYGREVMRTVPAETAREGWSTSYGRARLPVPAEMTLYQGRIGAALFWLTLCLFALLAFMTWRR
ncbi:MAG: apolipoprotein N-acyltransferase [Hyphomonas sp.]